MNMQNIARVTARSLILTVLFVGVVLASGVARAQDEPVRKAVSGRTAPREQIVRDLSPWSLQIRGGMMTSGDIFRVNTEVSRNWAPPVGGDAFSSDKFKVTLDENFMVGMGIGYAINADVALRLDMDMSQLDATALARTGQTVIPVLYDEITFMTYALDIQTRLMRTRNHPYLLAGLVLCTVDGKGETLDQTRTGFKLGLGFEADMAPNWGFRFEAVDTIIQIDTDEHRESLGEEIQFSELGPQNLFGFSGGLLVRF